MDETNNYNNSEMSVSEAIERLNYIKHIHPYEKDFQAIDKGEKALRKLTKIKDIVNSDLGDKYAYDEILEVLEEPDDYKENK